PPPALSFPTRRSSDLRVTRRRAGLEIAVERRQLESIRDLGRVALVPELDLAGGAAAVARAGVPVVALFVRELEPVAAHRFAGLRSEEHTSELQSRENL